MSSSAKLEPDLCQKHIKIEPHGNLLSPKPEPQEQPQETINTGTHEKNLSQKHTKNMFSQTHEKLLCPKLEPQEQQPQKTIKTEPEEQEQSIKSIKTEIYENPTPKTDKKAEQPQKTVKTEPPEPEQPQKRIKTDTHKNVSPKITKTEQEEKPEQKSQKHVKTELEEEKTEQNSPKRVKTDNHENPSPKTDNEDNDPMVSEEQEPDCCGICLYDGIPIRGKIDSCSHFFCFICIMEWAKVESRCPLCKQRFGRIERDVKEGVNLTKRVVNVPVRDQIYHISGNATIESRDPYANVRCSVCDSVGDENLLLLCDLCDIASHTHCVGLGTTVPEGDWFCHDCTLSKAEHKKNEDDENCIAEMRDTYLSADDIVRESRPREVNPTNGTTAVNSERNQNIATSAHEFGARTLRHCRDVHVRVRALRENWSAIRSGSLSFTSSSINLHKNRSERSKQSNTSTPSQQAASGSSACDKKCSQSPYDVDKAWKMMNKAKSIKQTQERKRTINQSPKQLLSKTNNPFTESRSKSLLLFSSSKSSVPHNHHVHCSSSKADTRHKPQIVANCIQGVDYFCFNGDDRRKTRLVAKPELGADVTKPIPRCDESRRSSHSQRDHGSLSSKKFYPSVEDDSRSADGGKLSRKNLHVLPSEHISKGEESVCLPSSSGSFNEDSVTSSVKLAISSSHKTILSNGLAPLGEARGDDPKSDIQVLVKLSLKLLARDIKLDVKVFKEIARLATHSLLAACGLEQPKPGLRSFPSSVCWHTNEAQNQQRMSTLMPNCCRECFHVFVKDVVNSIMVERLGYS